MALRKRYQQGRLIMTLCIATMSSSLYAERSGYSHLHVGSGFASYTGAGAIGSQVPFILYVPPFPGHSFYSPCYPYANCAAFHRYQLEMKRKERFQRLREQSEQRAMELSTSLPQQKRKLYRTDEKEILPELRDYSQIRPEYTGAGKYLPKFLEENASKTGK